MRARPVRSRRTKRASADSTLKINLLLLALSLVFLAGTAKLFHMVNAQHLYQPIEWRINKMAMKTPEPTPVKKQEQEKKKVTASGMDYLFWDILRNETPVDRSQDKRQQP